MNFFLDLKHLVTQCDLPIPQFLSIFWPPGSIYELLATVSKEKRKDQRPKTKDQIQNTKDKRQKTNITNGFSLSQYTTFKWRKPKFQTLCVWVWGRLHRDQQVGYRLLHHGLVELLLAGGEGTVDQHLLLGRDLQTNICLHTTSKYHNWITGVYKTAEKDMIELITDSTEFKNNIQNSFKAQLFHYNIFQFSLMNFIRRKKSL